MEQINRKIKIPFQKIEYTSSLVRLKKMDELESLIMILIVSASELNFKLETLAQALDSQYNIRTHTHPIIKAVLFRLIKSKTIDMAKSKAPDDLLNEKIRLINASIDKEIKEKILNGEFYKKEMKYRKVFGSLLEPIVESTTLPQNIREYKYDDKWDIRPLDDIVIEDIAENNTNKQKNDMESIEFLEVDKDLSAITYVECEVTLAKSGDKKLFPKNENAQILFNNIMNKTISSDYFNDVINTSIDNLPLLKEEGIEAHNMNSKHFTIGAKTLVIDKLLPYILFNKEIEYKVDKIDLEITAKELYAMRISISELVDMIIKGESKQVDPLLSSMEHEIQEEVLSRKINSQNEWLIRHYFDKQTMVDKTTKYEHLFSGLYNEMEIREVIIHCSKNELSSSIQEINSFISNNSIKDLYEAIYEKVKIRYDETTSLFPMWKAEINFKKLINDLPVINSKIDLIETKSDAQNVIKYLYEFSITPIVSNLFDKLISRIKRILESAPVSEKSEIKHYGELMRPALEEFVGREQKDTFNNALDSLLKSNKELMKFKSDIKKIYKKSNNFHHHESIAQMEYNEKEEMNVKRDIKKLHEIVKATNKKINNIERMNKWAIK